METESRNISTITKLTVGGHTLNLEFPKHGFPTSDPSSPADLHVHNRSQRGVEVRPIGLVADQLS